MHSGLLAYKGHFPKLEADVFVAPGAWIIGNATIAKQANIWFNTVIRADVNEIVIGSRTNIQDNCTIHVMPDGAALIGADVTVGHGAIIHACSIGDNCLIGMGTILLNYCQIGNNCIIAAGSLIPEHKVIPDNSLVIGSPGKVVRSLSAAEHAMIRESALSYCEEALNYR